VAVDEKSNEITAIPELLKLLVVEGCIVTINRTQIFPRLQAYGRFLLTLH
jgi:hypothetical protein